MKEREREEREREREKGERERREREREKRERERRERERYNLNDQVNRCHLDLRHDSSQKQPSHKVELVSSDDVKDKSLISVRELDTLEP